MALPVDDLITEIAIEQWALILDQAEAVHMAEDKARAKRLVRLEISPHDDDRRIAQLVRRRLKARD